jgi:hypothetical protein
MANRTNHPTKQFCKHGHDTFVCGRDYKRACNDCNVIWKEKHPNYQKDYYVENHDQIRENHKEYNNINKDKVVAAEKAWRDDNRDYFVKREHEYYEKNKESILTRNKEWSKNNRDIVNALKIKNQTNRNLRVVAWTDWDVIKEIYKNCPKGYEVDHIIPLQGKLVSGLHVSWNLQYLTPPENRIKGSKIDLSTPS